MKKEMLINVLQPEECRIAILEDGVLEELYVERTSHESYVGNVYKGRIVNIEPSIQAAFVDFGVGRNGFLHVSDVEPAYYRHLEEGQQDNGSRRGRDRHRGGGGRSSEPRDRDRGRREAPGFEDVASTAIEDDDAPPSQPRSSESGPQESSGRGRRRGGRGRGRSRRSEGTRPGADVAGDEFTPDIDTPHLGETHSEAESPPPVQEQPEGESFGYMRPEDPPYMDSAERHTDEDTPPTDPIEPSADISDDELFFPRQDEEAGDTRSEEPPARAPHHEEPHWQPRSSESEPETTDEAPPHSADEVWEEELFEAETVAFERPQQDEEAPPQRPMRHGFDDDFSEAPRRPRRGGDRGDRRGDRRGGPRRAPGRPGFGRPKPLIQDIFRRGQEVLVQVIKEGIGTKGPTLSTYISIAGRYLVLMPGLNRIGVSRKIADEEQRRRLRDILHELQPPKGLGFIIRTAGLDRTKKELQRDLAYLSRLWQVVVRRIRKVKGPSEIYQESDMITRTIRDTFTSEIDTIWVDERQAYEHAKEFMDIVMPRYAGRIKLYDDPEPMFHKYGIENELARIQQRHLPLPNGGSLVIDQTEALVAIDVNSGNFRADNNAEETAYQMNLLAAREIARQLRLRDLGGVIVNDFIDMRDEKHRRGVERALRDALKRDRARTKILKMSAFGLIEMTRQRIRPSLKRSVYQDCPHCVGTGQVKTTESMSIDVMRMLQLAAHHEDIQRVQIRVHEDVANYLLNKKRKEIAGLEEQRHSQITVVGAAGVSPETLEFACYDSNNNELKVVPPEEPRRVRRR